MVGLLTQTLIVHMIRTPKIPFLQSRAAMPLMVMTGIIMSVGIFLPLILLAYMALTQAVKGFYIRRFGWQ